MLVSWTLTIKEVPLFIWHPHSTYKSSGLFFQEDSVNCSSHINSQSKVKRLIYYLLHSNFNLIKRKGRRSYWEMQLISSTVISSQHGFKWTQDTFQTITRWSYNLKCHGNFCLLNFYSKANNEVSNLLSISWKICLCDVYKLWTMHEVFYHSKL